MAGSGLWADLVVVLGAAAGVCSAGFPPFLRRTTSVPGDQERDTFGREHGGKTAGQPACHLRMTEYDCVFV